MHRLADHAGRTFRVFVSSTFTDLQDERRVLAKEVFPRVEAHCAARGYRLQPVDLRWGVGRDDALSHRTMSICLEEVHRCLAESPAPIVIGIIGDRYGWRPVPELLPANVFDRLVAWAQDNPGDGVAAETVRTWYERDDNAVPPMVELVSRNGDFAKDPAWDRERAVLQSTLQAAARALDLDRERERRLLGSATERELFEGPVADPRGAETLVCVMRHLRGVPVDAAGAAFRDLVQEPDGSWAVDTEAEGMLETLRRDIRAFKGDDVLELEADWRPDGPTRAHLPKFAEQMERELLTRIDAAIERIGRDGGPAVEASRHQRFAAERRAHFVGRDAERARVLEYVDRGTGRPFFVHGIPGAGKSAFLAELGYRLLQRGGGRVLQRFVGATPSSYDIRSTLASMAQEVLPAADGDEDAGTGEGGGADGDGRPGGAAKPDPVALRRDPEVALEAIFAGPDHPVVVLVDALDQLPDADLRWLPSALPDHVRLIVSSTTAFFAEHLEGRVPTQDVQVVDDLDGDQAGELLDVWLDEDAGRFWLGEEGRKLQTEQRDHILDSLGKHAYPLPLRLAFEEARRWTSSQLVGVGEAIEPLPEETPALIDRLFTNLHRRHPAALVDRSIALLAAAHHGLAERELLQILAKDEAVLAALQSDAVAAHRVEDEIPTVVWSRLFNELRRYLGLREAQGDELLTFFHNRLREVAVDRYHRDPDASRSHHNCLATWFEARPVVVFDPDDPQLEAPDERRLAELPFQLMSAGRFDDAYDELTNLGVLELRAEAPLRAAAAGVRSDEGFAAVLEDIDALLARWPAA